MVEQRRRTKDWHMSEKVISGIIVALSVTIIGQIAGGIYLFQQLNTSPPIPERVLKLEYQMSDFAQTMLRMNHTLDKFSIEMKEAARERRIIKNEQSRRTPMVDFIEKQHMRKNGAH